MKIKDCKVGKLYKLNRSEDDGFKGMFDDDQVFLCIQHKDGVAWFKQCIPRTIATNALCDGDASEVKVATRKMLDDMGFVITRELDYMEIPVHQVIKDGVYLAGYPTYGGAYAYATKLIKEALS